MLNGVGQTLHSIDRVFNRIYDGSNRRISNAHQLLSEEIG
jgi:hypothetical protein